MIKLTFLGDAMCKSQMISAYKTKEGYDFDIVFEKMVEYFRSSDLVLVNLETPVSFLNDSLTSERFCFNSPYEYAESAYNSGIRFAATANNHCLDRGIQGIASTIESLDEIGFLHTGVFKDKERKSTITQIGNLKFGILSYTYGTNAFSNNNYLKKSERHMVNLFQNQELSNPIFRYTSKNHDSFIGKVLNKIFRKLRIGQLDKPVYERTTNDKAQKKQLLGDIKRLKDAGVDFIIMYMHAGGQYNSEPIKYTKELTDFLLNNDVDIIAGSHEHVIHGGYFDDINKNKLATYSLGNFIGIAGVYDQPFDKMAEYSIAWNIYFDDDNKKISKTTFSVLKTIELSEQKVQTVPAYDLILNSKAEEKEKLISDVLKSAEIFSGKKYDSVSQEFII